MYLLPSAHATRWLLAASVALIVSYSAAADDPPKEKRLSPPDNRANPTTARSGMAGLGDLGRILTDEQREMFRSALQEQRAALRSLEETLPRIRQELDEAMLAETLDESAVRSKVKQLTDAESERMLIRARAIAKIRPTLTPEQLQQVRESMSQSRRIRRPEAPPAGLDGRRPTGGPDTEREAATLPPPKPAKP